VYVKEHLAVTKLCDYTNRHTSAYWFLLHQPYHPPVIYGNIYHPPNLLKKQRDETINHIITTMSKYLNKHKSAKFCLCGDFNDLETGAITTLFPITQLVDFPTRGENILDKIFTDVDEYINIGYNRQPAILLNDHCALSIEPTSRKQQPRYHTVKKHMVTPKSKIALTEELSGVSWQELHDHSSVDDKVELFQNTINALYDKHCPMRYIRVPSGSPVSQLLS
jgi:hypothetical protein